uniref:Uncharacterized protein n=1 Tax=viral metagenome TaxID=1070528 RepID=A0A6M3L2A6_9ZZZZ
MSPPRIVEELLDKLDKNRAWTYAELTALWGCSTSAARARIQTGRDYGIPVTITRASPGKGKSPSPEWDRRTVYKDDLGDPSLPLCPRCKRHGRHGPRPDNKPVHYSRNGIFIYCLACAQEPEPPVELPNGNGKVKQC